MDILSLIPWLVAGGAIGGVVTYFFTRRVKQWGAGADGDESENKVISATQEIGLVIGIFAALGVAALAVACFGLSSPTGPFPSIFGIDLLVGAAAGALGGLLGFIFGVPRTIEAARDSTDQDRVVLGANTNLERVSDWLTTALIGATLVQIKDVPGWIKGVSDYLGEGGLTNIKVIPFVSVYFFVLAFLGVYLISRLYLTAALKEALGFVSGVGGVAATVGLGERLTRAIAEGTPEGLHAALDLVANQKLTDAERRDPLLNRKLVSALSQYIATGKADDAAARRAQLKLAVTNAAADPTQKSALQQTLQTKKLTSGDAGVDQEMLKLVS